MNAESRVIQCIYLVLLLLHTLAASFIWGINTLFLLDAGLSNAQAFAANAFFTAGLVLFEVPTGVIADTRGRRVSYLLGTVTLAVATLLYLWMWRVSAPFWAWAVTSAFLGLGFTFFSGAVEAWLVDALEHSGFDGRMESVFAKGLCRAPCLPRRVASHGDYGVIGAGVREGVSRRAFSSMSRTRSRTSPTTNGLLRKLLAPASSAATIEEGSAEITRMATLAPSFWCLSSFITSNPLIAGICRSSRIRS